MAVSKKEVIKAVTKDYETRLGSYASNAERSLKKQCDRLTVFAYLAMDTLEKNGIEDFVLLKNDDLRAWWKSHKEAMTQEAADKAERLRRYELKQQALAKLTPEEREALGIKK
jgi:hypothetical protein